MDHTVHGLEPLPYHRELRDYLKSRERELWDWFASAKAKENYTETLRLELLKATYRLDAESSPELYRHADEAKSALGLDIPVTLYQAQESSHLNAVLYFIQGEGQVVFSGPALNVLNPLELKTVIGHELAHYLLWQRDGGDFLIADRLVEAEFPVIAVLRHKLQGFVDRARRDVTEVSGKHGNLAASGVKSR